MSRLRECWSLPVETSREGFRGSVRSTESNLIDSPRSVCPPMPWSWSDRYPRSFVAASNTRTHSRLCTMGRFRLPNQWIITLLDLLLRLCTWCQLWYSRLISHFLIPEPGSESIYSSAEGMLCGNLNPMATCLSATSYSQERTCVSQLGGRDNAIDLNWIWVIWDAGPIANETDVQSIFWLEFGLLMQCNAMPSIWHTSLLPVTRFAVPPRFENILS